MTRLTMWMAATLIALLSGCVTNPESGTRIQTRTDAVLFSGYAKVPSSRVVLKARNWVTGRMEEIGATDTQANVGIGENTWGTHPALYAWHVTLPIANASNLGQRFRRRECEPEDYPDDDSPLPPPCSIYESEIVISQPADGNFELWTLPRGGLRCVVDALQVPGAELIESFVRCSTQSSRLSVIARR